MDLFTFTTKTAYINSLNTVKELENELRNLHDKVEIYSSMYNGKETDSSISIEELARPFLLYTQCFKRFEEKSIQRLPDFLYTRRKYGATTLLGVIVRRDLQIPYEQYIDIFKHMGTIDIVLPGYTTASKLGLKAGMGTVIKISEIVGNNDNPYNLNYSNVAPSSLYNEACYGHSTKAKILQAIAIRQTLLNDKPYTILENFLNVHLNKVTLDPEESALIVNMGKILTSAAIEYQKLANA